MHCSTWNASMMFHVERSPVLLWRASRCSTWNRSPRGPGTSFSTGAGCHEVLPVLAPFAALNHDDLSRYTRNRLNPRQKPKICLGPQAHHEPSCWRQERKSNVQTSVSSGDGPHCHGIEARLLAREILRSSMPDANVIKLKLTPQRRQKGGSFASGVHQGQSDFRLNDPQGNARDPGAGPNISQLDAPLRNQPAEQQRFQEQYPHHRLRLARTDQVVNLVPDESQIQILTEHGELCC